MAILKAVNVRVGRNANLKGIINYVLQPKKTEEQLTTGLCCDVPNALETMTETKKIFQKTKGRQYYHFVQSFPPNENITAKQAHSIAVMFAEKCKKFMGYELVIATHKDRDHIHTHFILNSVNFLDGHKFHITRKELALMKEMQNQICIKNGFSPAPEKGFDMFGKKRETPISFNTKLYKVLTKVKQFGLNSYIQNCCDAFIQSIKMAQNKDQFIQLMHAQGFDTNWKENKKHITFTDIKLKASGVKKCKVRLNKLSQYFPTLKEYKTKEDILNGITRYSNSAITRNNNRYSASTDNQNKSNIGRTSELIDFNSRFEQYASECDRKRSEQSTNTNHRLTESSSSIVPGKHEIEYPEVGHEFNDNEISGGISR